MRFHSSLRQVFAASSACLTLLTFTTSASRADDTVFDELRFGTSVSISGRTHESGIFPSATVFFDPLSSGAPVSWQQALLEPRIYVGASVGAGDGVDQVFAGFAWTANITQKLFLEVGLGGTVHNGDLRDDGSDGPKLGCRLLFREQVAIGYRVTENWQLMATADHSSHANLCDGPNNGLSHAGLALGYKF